MASAAFKAISDIPPYGNWAAACNWYSEALTKSLELVPRACFKQYAKWGGHCIELFSAPTSFGDGVRVRPLRKPATVAEPDPDLGDAIPF
jgi:hypothetical protein